MHFFPKAPILVLNAHVHESKDENEENLTTKERLFKVAQRQDHAFVSQVDGISYKIFYKLMSNNNK